MSFSLVGQSTFVVSAYLFFAYVSTIFFLVPYWAYQFALPSWRPHKSWTLKDTIAIRLLHRAASVLSETGWNSPPDANKAAEEDSEKDTGFVWVNPAPIEHIKGWIAIAATENNVLPARVSGYWYGKREASTGRADYPAGENEKVIYELHSGAYVAGSAHPNHDVTPIIPNLLSKCSNIAERAFSIEYRLCAADPFPAANPFPASLLDALAGYRYLVEEMKFKPENIYIEGFSAGAHLAIDLVLYLKQNKIPSLPPPKALLLISPMIDLALTHNGPGSSVQKFKDIDVLANALLSGYPARALRGNISETEFVSNAYLSPGSKQVGSWLASTFSEWPKTCMVTGDSEAILDGANSFWAKLLQDNETKDMDWFRYMQYDDMPHGFIAPYAFSKQRDKALSDIGSWMKLVAEK